MPTFFYTMSVIISFSQRNKLLNYIFDILKRNSQLTKSFKDKEFGDLTDLELAQYRERVDNVKYWLDTYAPKFVKFQVQEKSVPKLPLTPEQDKFLADLADMIESTEFTDAAALHDAMYEILESQGLKPQKGFQAIYSATLARLRHRWYWLRMSTTSPRVRRWH